MNLFTMITPLSNLLCFFLSTLNIYDLLTFVNTFTIHMFPIGNIRTKIFYNKRLRGFGHDELWTPFTTIKGTEKLTVNQLAMYSGVSSAGISRIENGKRGVPKPATIRKLADALKVPYEELMASAGYISASTVQEARSSYDSIYDIVSQYDLEDLSLFDSEKWKVLSKRHRKPGQIFRLSRAGSKQPKQKLNTSPRHTLLSIIFVCLRSCCYFIPYVNFCQYFSCLSISYSQHLY